MLLFSFVALVKVADRGKENTTNVLFRRWEERGTRRDSLFGKREDLSNTYMLKKKMTD